MFPPDMSLTGEKKKRPARILERGVEIIGDNYRSVQIRSQLQRKLVEAGSGGSSANAPVFFACFTALLRTV